MSKNLQQENEKLRKKLSIAESWMKREIQNQMLLISKKHLQKDTTQWYAELVSNEMEDIITQKIQSFFSDTPLYDIPSSFLENIVKSEIGYYILKKWIQIDNLAVTIGYQKCFESIIEYTISKGFRTWAQKHISPQKSISPLEDTIKKVIEKGYILWIGKLYHVLTQKEVWIYTEALLNFIEQDTLLKNTLLSESFLIQLEHVVKSEVFGSKRHLGEITPAEIDAIRLWCIGNLEDKTCLIYRLFATQSII